MRFFVLGGSPGGWITISEGTRRGAAFEEVREVAGSLVVECLVGGDQYFEIYSVYNWEPVKAVEDWN